MQKLIIALILFVSGTSIASAQLSSVPVDTEKDPHIQSYNYTAAEAGVYTISIVNPQGETQTVLVVNEEMDAPSTVDFRFSTKWWKNGTYTILVENDKGYMFTQDLRVGQAK